MFDIKITITGSMNINRQQHTKLLHLLAVEDMSLDQFIGEAIEAHLARESGRQNDSLRDLATLFADCIDEDTGGTND